MLLPIRNMGSSSTGGIPNLVHLESTNYGINGSWQMSLWFLLGNSLYNINGGFLENHETKWWIFFSKPPLDYQRVNPPSKITIVCWLYQVISQEFPEIATDSHHKIRKKNIKWTSKHHPWIFPWFLAFRHSLHVFQELLGIMWQLRLVWSKCHCLWRVFFSMFYPLVN